jgi:CBS domain-containing protein
MSDNLSFETIQSSIRLAQSAEELRAIRDRVHEWYGIRAKGERAVERSEAVNSIHDALIDRSVAIAESAWSAEAGPLPCPYAFVLFGSGGRREQTLWSDQDNGLVYAGGADEEALYGEYFRELAERIGQALESVGYPPCSGNVLSTNPKWRKPLSSWTAMMDGWMDDPQWEHVRYLLIVADARCIRGDRWLTERLLDHMDSRLRRESQLLAAMLRNTLHHKVAVGVFGQLITERYGDDAGAFDVKYGAYIPMVNALRLLAYAHGVRESSSLARIEGLRRKGLLDDKLAHEWALAFEAVLKLRSETSYQLEDGYYTTRGMLTLDRERRAELRRILRAGRRMQQIVRREIEKASIAKKG